MKQNGDTLPEKGKSMDKFTAKEVKELLKGYEMPEGNITAAANELCASHNSGYEDIKNERDDARKEAKKLADTQAELEALKKDISEKYVAKSDYEKAVKDLDDYKADIDSKTKAAERAAAVDKAVREHLTASKITGNNQDIAIMALSEIMKSLELDGEKIKDTKALDEVINGKLKAMQGGDPTVKHTNVDNPPNNNGAPGQTSSRAKEIADRMHSEMFGAAPTTTKGA